MYVCLSLNNSGTAGPIRLNFFFVTSVLVTGWFYAKKIPDPESSFSENLENLMYGFIVWNYINPCILHVMMYGL